MTAKKMFAVASLLVAICLCGAAWERAAAPRVPSARPESPAVGEISGRITFEGEPPPLQNKVAHPEIMIFADCNQHPWMEAYIGVTSNPFFAVSGDDGKFVIQGVPPGQFTLGAWTATFGTQERKVTVEPGQTVKADFV